MQNEETQNNIENENTAENISEAENSYDFLNTKNTSVNDSDEVVDQFDLAFKQSSPVIQDYILNDKLEENIKLICKIEKLEDEKSKIILENIVVSILVGLLPITEAKQTLIESFKSSGIIIETFAAGMIIKNIDAYILSDIRKSILTSKVENVKEIRHLTLKEKEEETEKEELRKILLERTGNITGKGDFLIGYKEREKNEEEKKEIEEKKEKQFNRESMLARLNLQNISDSEKISERMQQIKKEEDLRMQRDMAKLQNEEARIQKIKEDEEKISIDNNIVKLDKENTISDDDNNNDENVDMSKLVANILNEKLSSHEDEAIDLDKIREERGKEEEKLNKIKTNNLKNEEVNENIYTKIQKVDEIDPYREDL